MLFNACQARVQFGMFSILVMLHHITAAVVSFPKNNNVGRHISHTSYSNGKGHNHKQIHHADDAYFYEYLVHGTNNENHHGETQYFGQAEYRDENNLAVSKNNNQVLQFSVSYIQSILNFNSGMILSSILDFRQILCSAPGWKSSSRKIQGG